jgi:hypothetical protein
MTVGCYVSAPGANGPEIWMFARLPRIGELVGLPGRDGDFEVISIRHSARAPSARTPPAVYLDLIPRPSEAERSAGETSAAGPGP